MTRATQRSAGARKPVFFATIAAVALLLLTVFTVEASAQRADDDSRPGGVEARPSVPAPAGADMSPMPTPSQLFRKPTVTSPVLPAPSAAPAAATTTAPAKPGAPPAATKPATDKPAMKKSDAAPDTQKKPAAQEKSKGAPTPADTEKLVTPPPAAAPATRSMRAPAPRAGAPMAPGSFKGDDSRPGGVERSPSRE